MESKFLRLTTLDGSLQLINFNHVDSVYAGVYKGQSITKVGLSCGVFIPVKETVSEISLLLQGANLVVK